MRHTTMAVCAALATSIAGCASMPAPGGDAPDAAVAAALRHAFGENASALGASAATYCVAAVRDGQRSDPAPSLLSALGDVRPMVARYSTCRVTDRVVDQAGRPSLVFTAEPLGCTANACTMRVGYWEGNVSSQTNQYTVRQMNGRWSVDAGATQLGPIS